MGVTDPKRLAAARLRYRNMTPEQRTAHEKTKADYRAAHRAHKEPFKRNCIICNGPFETSIARQETCGGECGKKNAVQLVRELRANRREGKPPRPVSIPKPPKEPKPPKPKPAPKPAKVPRTPKQTPNRPKSYVDRRTEATLDPPGLSWDRPAAEPTILQPPPFTPTVGASVVFSGPVVEKKVGDWRKSQF